METEPQKRRQQIHVPVFPWEKKGIEDQAKRAGMKVARYLREVGLGHTFKGVLDYEQVRELAKINGDLGRIGGLLKLWLTNDERTAKFGESTINAVLARIVANQEKMAEIMTSVVMPRGAADDFSG